MIIFYAIGEKEKARELVRVITKTRWKIVSKHAVKLASSSIGPTVVILKPTKAGLAVALWLHQRAKEMGMISSVGWFTPIEGTPDDVAMAIQNDLKRKFMVPLEVPWSPK
ncbi:hypothetical protein HS7_11030 [Sulfolobales archaeon HS-7]|nr:hypothetical protein HS7_11030 [Sulfolobales archaeon HS-7]